MAFNRPSRNVTVINNVLCTGMGLSIGSSVSVEDVIYANNTMSETREQWGQGVHVKTRLGIGGYIRNIVWDSNEFISTGTEAIIIEAGYQSGGSCDKSNCTVIQDIVLKNLTFHNASVPGRIVCSSVSPCTNITFDRVNVNGYYKHNWGVCSNVNTNSFKEVSPPGIEELCNGAATIPPQEKLTQSKKMDRDLQCTCRWNVCLLLSRRNTTPGPQRTSGINARAPLRFRCNGPVAGANHIRNGGHR